MKASVIVLLAILAVVIVGGAFAVNFIHQVADVTDGGESGTFHKIADKVDKVTSSDGSHQSTDSSGGDGNILSEVIKDNGQNGEGSYREVNYKDGGFRQFDTKTGDMIGSSYDEDQEELGVTNGNLE